MNSRNLYVEFVKNWYWLIAIGVIVSVGATHLAIRDQSTVYRSTATLQVGRTLEIESPGQDELAITDRLVTVYGELATRDPVLEVVIANLDLPLMPADLRARMLVQASPSTQLIDIVVVESDPAVGAAIANEVARQVALSSPGPTADTETQRFLTDQLNDLQGKITAAQEERQEVETEMLGMTSAADVYNAEERLGLLDAQIESWQQTYGVLLTQLEPSATNVVRVITDATESASPLPQRTTLYYGFAILMGAGLATLIALALTYFDRSIRNSEDLESSDVDVPVVDIPSFNTRKQTSVVTLRDPASNSASAYRVLRNVLKLSMDGERSGALMITSAGIGEGKTTTTANLAVALANSGTLVIVVDANFHNPELDELFGSTVQPGFSDLVLGRRSAREVIQETEHPYLWLLGSGTVPPNYLDVLASDQIKIAVNSLLQQADVVLFDSPALDQEQDAQLLAKTIDQVILIAESTRATRESIAEATDMIQNAGAQLAVIVVNKVRRPWHSYLLQWPWSRERRLEARATARRRRKTDPAASSLPEEQVSTSTAD